jgi:glycosyltransferase involved in cell wall biosynthesis
MHIMIACRKFGGVIGGVERMAITLMNEMVARGHQITLFTWDNNSNAESFYKLDSRIHWVKLVMGNPAQKAGMMLRLRRMLRVRSILRQSKPDVILAFQEGAFVTLQLYSLGQGIPVICSIRNSPFRDETIPISPPVWFTNVVLRMAAAATVQFERYISFFPSAIRGKFRTIPNHVIAAQSLAIPDATNGEKILLTTGRLSPEKNQSVLIEAFAKIAEKFPDWKLVVVGRGGLEDSLKKQISTYNPAISGRVILAGASDDVPSWLVKSHLFCLPSYWEGFPNSLSEAMAHGLPCVGFSGCDGVNDLIEDGKTGLLAKGKKDAATLSEKLEILMADAGKRKQMGLAGLEKTKQYDSKKIFDMWEKMLKEVAKEVTKT